MTPPERELAIVGLVRRAHGIRGELAVETFGDEPAAVFAAGRRLLGATADGARLLPADPKRPVAAGGEPLALTVAASSPFRGGLIVRFAEIADRTAADAWRERALMVPYDELPAPDPDELYVHELVGMRVTRPDGSPVGEVADVYELPQGLALDVRLDGGDRTAIVPYRDEMGVSVDVAARTVTVDPPDGLLD